MHLHSYDQCGWHVASNCTVDSNQLRELSQPSADACACKCLPCTSNRVNRSDRARASDRYWQNRAAFLESDTDDSAAYYLRNMTGAVTLTHPDLNEVVELPWPGHKATRLTALRDAVQHIPPALYIPLMLYMVALVMVIGVAFWVGI